MTAKMVAYPGKAAILAIFLVACNPNPADLSANETKADESFRQWKLPAKLRELSGLALTSDERLLGVTDEEAIVYEIDYENGRLVKSFAFGEPVLRGDFEGIAVLDDYVWLMTSKGQLFKAAEGANGAHVQYQQIDTGLGKYCEFEGLAQDRENGLLLLACKETKSKGDDLKIFELSVAGNRVSTIRDVAVPTAAIGGKIGSKHVNPSAIAVEPKTRRRIMVAARQRALFQLSSEGDLIDAIILPKKKRHRQAEGIEITSDGRLLIADEGGDGRARLAVYRVTPFGIIKN
jgi:uncharacterized protein YjiK